MRYVKRVALFLLYLTFSVTYLAWRVLEPVVRPIAEELALDWRCAVLETPPQARDTTPSKENTDV